MPQPQDVERQVRKFISDRFFHGRTDELPADSLLLGSVIDSAGLLELITFLQERFKITVADDDIVPEHFGTVQQFIDYVNGRLKSKTASA